MAFWFPRIDDRSTIASADCTTGCLRLYGVYAWRWRVSRLRRLLKFRFLSETRSFLDIELIYLC